MKRQVLRRVIALLLMLAGAGGLFSVSWLLPWLVRDSDPAWLKQHSQQAQWEAAQQRIRFSGWWHDDFGPVGAYGGKEWAEWIMGRLSEEADPRECGSGHKVGALENITNYSPRTDDSAPWKPWKEVLPQWLDWWEKNRRKTQDEWMVDGFAAVGVRIHNPPLKEDWPALLKVLGTRNPKLVTGTKEEGHEQPKPLIFNARRCLRDSGFNPVKFALEEEITPELKAGLLAYSEGQRSYAYSWGREPGRLFGHGKGSGVVAHRWVEPAFRWGWSAAAAVVLMAGFWLYRGPPRWLRALWSGLVPGE